MLTVIPDRDALYYPYVHVRDLNWLKSTLLCFPCVHRIVPEGYPIRSDVEAAIAEFSEHKGARGEALVPNPQEDAKLLRSASVWWAQERLLEKLRQHDRDIRKKYSIRVAKAKYGEAWKSFEIHEGKVLRELLRFMSVGADPLAKRTESDGPGFVAVHPALGKAVMSTVALAIAADAGLDIVTPSRSTHKRVSARREDEVFDELLGIQPPEAERSLADVTEDLTQVVMQVSFDVSQLTAADIAELQKDGKDLRSFKREIAGIAAEIPQMRSDARYEQRLQAAAGEVIERWRTYKASLPTTIATAISDTAGFSLPGVSTAAIASTNPFVLAAGAGLAIYVTVTKGRSVWRTYQEASKGPYRYLSRVEKLTRRGRGTAKRLGSELALPAFPGSPPALQTNAR